MSIPRRAGIALQPNAADASKWDVRLGTDANSAAPGTKLPGPAPIDTTGATTGQGLAFNGTEYVPAAASGGRQRLSWAGTVTGNGSNVRNNYLGQDYTSNTGNTAHGVPVGPGTLSRLRVHVPANGLLTTTTIYVSVATGGSTTPSTTAILATIGGGVPSGELNDLIDTVTTVEGDRVSILVSSAAGGAGAGTIECEVSLDFAPSS